MENKNVGYLIVGIAVVIAIIVFMFNTVLKENLGLTCSHGPSCEMYTNLKVQTGISLAIVGVILVIGLFLIFSKPNEKIIVEKEKIRVHVKEKQKKFDTSKLDSDEKKVVELLMREGKAMFQADLMEKLGIGKVGMTRLLDKLEAKQFIERKRRGMNNIVILKS